MRPNFTLQPLVAASFILALSCVPANAVPGHLGGYSARHVRHSSYQLRTSLTARVKTARRHRFQRTLAHIRHALAHFSRSKRTLRLADAQQPGENRHASSVSFLWQAPASSDRGELSNERREVIADAFMAGHAEAYSPSMLREANVFSYDPLHGGIYERAEEVKFIILHSTETGRPADAPRVIASWNHHGLRHPGAQFVVDRDGTIYNTVDPAYATVHVNQHKTLLGVNNDNSIGIEIVHTGDQDYTEKQINSVACLVSYLQARYSVPDSHIYTHHMVQPSDRTDPVNFDWARFAMDRSQLKESETAFNERSHVAPARAPSSEAEGMNYTRSEAAD